jgi:23S rRNA (cytosine1962-C5)-methyltransferase
MNAKVVMFGNRLRKNLRRLLPWAAQRGVEAYRLYDRDIPEVRLVVDRYGPALVVYPYVHAAEMTEQEEAEQASYLDELLQALADLTGVPPEQIYVKERRRQRGTAQYERLADAAHELVIHENGHRLLVNLSDYLDTGLFLDHRDTRALVQRLAAGRRVLNLFGYTGSFSVYAAKGGALSTVNVDLSTTYLDWARRNLQLNGLNLSAHRQVRADVMAMLRDPLNVPEVRGPFDLIVLDPPTFSNSKRMHGTFDLKRDHEWLLRGTLRFLAPGGVLLFSSNRRGFRLLPADFSDLRIRDISQETLPRDFHDAQGRVCYLIEPTQTAHRPTPAPHRYPHLSHLDD